MWLIITASVVVLCFLGVLRIRKNNVEFRADLLKVFADAGMPLPALEFGSSFGWPTFKVIFKCKEDLDFAKEAKLTDAFKSRVQLYHRADFEADRAVTFTYEGHSYF